MRIYKIGKQLECVESETLENASTPAVIIMTMKEALQEDWKGKSEDAIRFLEQGIRFCKTEEIDECLAGSFYVPSHSMKKGHIGFHYMLEGEHLLFVDDSGYAEEKIEKLRKYKTWDDPTVGMFFADFLEQLIKEDVIFITKLEEKLTHLEDEVLNDNPPENFNHLLSGYRRKIMRFSNYYLQLADVSTALIGDDNHYFKEEAQRLFQLFTDRANRLRDETQMLREYCVQIREIYQSNIDIRQNQIMKVLTIVTTVFMPLTLIAGWYGMNFINMPELQWKYGYPVVVIVSLVIVGILVWIMKKKKFWE